MFVSILERQTAFYGSEEKLVTWGKQLARKSEPKYSDAFFATYMVSDSTQIVTNFAHSPENRRNLRIKIGRITDYSILNKIKNENSTGFADLLKYAKSNKGIYDEVTNLKTQEYEFDIRYGTDDGYDPIGLQGLVNGAYYYLYVELDDEDGKYITQEAVTLATASVNGNDWGMFFYGDESFKWANFDSGEKPSTTPTKTEEVDGKDDTTIKEKLPQTGESAVIVISIITAIGIAVFFAKKYKKYNV